jgi:hypothetical protein
MFRKICTLGATLAVLPALVLAAEGQQVEAARQCAQQKDSLQRLVCYDRIFLADEASPVAAAAAPAAVAAPVAAAPAAVVAPVAVAPAAVAAPAAAAVVAAPKPAAVAPALGDESLKKNKKDVVEAPKSMEARVTAVRETRPQLFRMTLENGQIWQQMESSSLFHVKNGDSVRIEKGSMGSYRMSLTKGSGWVRVTRVE